MSTKPIVIFDPLALADILLAVHVTPVEVSGLGQVEKNGDVYTIKKDLLILEQTCSQVETDFLPAYFYWTQKMMREGRGPEIDPHRLWWHSHVYGNAFFSVKDRNTIASWGEPGTRQEWWLSLVANKFGNIHVRLDVFRPELMPPIEIENILLTENISKDDFKELMLERKERMIDIVKRNIVFNFRGDNDELDRMLGGLFNE